MHRCEAYAKDHIYYFGLRKHTTYGTAVASLLLKSPGLRFKCTPDFKAIGMDATGNYTLS